VPIVEPEILPDGDHDLETSLRVTEQVQLLVIIILPQVSIWSTGVNHEPSPLNSVITAVL